MTVGLYVRLLVIFVIFGAAIYLIRRARKSIDE